MLTGIQRQEMLDKLDVRGGNKERAGTWPRLTEEQERHSLTSL